MRNISLRRGFTLIEMLAVIAIIAILMGLITTAVMKSRVSAMRTKAQTDIAGLYKAYEEYKFKYGEYPDNPAGTDSDATNLEYDLSTSSGLLYTYEKARIFTFDKEQLEGSIIFKDPFGAAYVWQDAASAPVTGMVGLPKNTGSNKIYIYSYGTGNASTATGDKSTEWIYKK